MGSFFSTCSISHMTLSGEKTSIQLLVPTFNKDFSDSLGMIVSNDGCQNFFAPFGFPIHGVYNDYGHLHSINRDKNVEILEDYFNLSIEQIIDNIGDDRWYEYGEKEGKDDWKIKGKDGGSLKNQDVFLTMGKTYFRTEVLEFLQKGYKDLLKPSKDEYSSETFTKEMLKGIDGEVDKPKGGIMRAVAELKERLGMGHFDDDPKMKSDVENMFKEIDAEGVEIPEPEEKPKYSRYRVRTYIPSLVHTNMFEELPITSKDFKEDIVKQYQFIRMFGGFGLNRTLLPSDYGSQETNWALLYDLNEVTNNLLDESQIDELVHQLRYYTKDGEEPNREGYEEDYGKVSNTIWGKAVKKYKNK